MYQLVLNMLGSDIFGKKFDSLESAQSACDELNMLSDINNFDCSARIITIEG